MSKPVRYHTRNQIELEIDRLNGLFPELEQAEKDARHKAVCYWAEIEFHKDEFDKAWTKATQTERNKMIEPVDVFKKLKRAAKRAKGAIGRNEKALLKLKAALAEFQTTRMPFLQDESVVVI